MDLPNDKLTRMGLRLRIQLLEKEYRLTETTESERGQVIQYELGQAYKKFNQIIAKVEPDNLPIHE